MLLLLRSLTVRALCRRREREAAGPYGDASSADVRVVGVLADFRPNSPTANTLSFYQDGQLLGVAFSQLDPAAVYYPCCGNSSGSMELRVGLPCPPETPEAAS